MWVKYLSICLLFVLRHGNVVYGAIRDSVEVSNLPFRYELEQVANEFREKLRKELSMLEMDMYNEFLQLVQDIDRNQRNLTEELTAQLSKKVSGVMSKFTKVMAYSTERTQVLHDKMKNLTISLERWAEHALDPSVFNRRGLDSQGRTATTEVDNGERRKRQTKTMATDGYVPIRNFSAAKRLLHLDPEDFPIVEDVKEIDAFLMASSDVDGDLENQESDFTLREYDPGTNTRYPLQRKRPEEESKSVPPREVLPRNCYDLLQEGKTQDGIYVIYPSGKDEALQVWCNQGTAGGGWTVILSRKAAATPLNFTRTPTQYTHGFGDVSSNYWIGLEVMHELSQGISHTLRVHLEDDDGKDAYASYDIFRVGGSEEYYTLMVGAYNKDSTAGDALSDHSGRPFTFPLPDSGESCSHALRVGWWYLEEPICYQALPTGCFRESDDEESYNGALQWTPWTGSGQSLARLSFMLRPTTI